MTNHKINATNKFQLRWVKGSLFNKIYIQKVRHFFLDTLQYDNYPHLSVKAEEKKKKNYHQLINHITNDVNDLCLTAQTLHV